MIIRNMLERDWNKQAMSDIKTYFLNVIANRDLSSKAASEFNVVHQSPQAIIIYKGNSIYDSSHGRIRYEELCKVLLKKENC
jgi:bacillithiol system protein YtxJ